MPDPITLGPRRAPLGCIVALALVPLLSLVAIESYTIYTTGRHVQDAADIAALAGARAVAFILQYAPGTEDQIMVEVQETLDGFEMPRPDELITYYVDAAGNRLQPLGTRITRQVSGTGATATMRAHTFLTRIFGLDGWLVTRKAVVTLFIEYPEDGGPPTVYSKINMDPLEK